MRNDKTPGTDGLTAEFYRYFWHEIADIMVDGFNYGFQAGRLSISQRQGVISLIYKKNKNLEYLKNWRPLSLLNTDYKIAKKTLACRLEKTLPTLISKSQTGYVKGRYIGENIRLISDLMYFTEHSNTSGIALFDSLEWSFLLKALKTFNFGPQFIHWIEVLYQDVSSCVMNNGFSSPFFSIHRGVHQGCPLSGLLFVIAIELLGNSIRQAKDIKGINVGLNEIKLTQYADDTTVFVSDVSSAKNLVELPDLFYECSGLKINSSKSEFLWLGPDRDSNDQVLNFLPPEYTVYALGVHFSYNKNAAEKKNFISKLKALKTRLNMWMIRDLSLYGKV